MAQKKVDQFQAHTQPSKEGPPALVKAQRPPIDTKSGNSSYTPAGQIASGPTRLQLQPTRLLQGPQFADVVGSNQQQFTIDKQEYQSVFRMFDKECTGSISINQVNQYITKFEEMHQQSAAQSNPAAKRPPGKGGRTAGHGVMGTHGGAIGTQGFAQNGNGYTRIKHQQIVTVTSNGTSKDHTYIVKGTDRLNKRNQMHSEKKPVGVQSGLQNKSGVPVVSTVNKATPQKTNQTERFGQYTSHQQNTEFSGSQGTTAATAVSSGKPVRVLHHPSGSMTSGPNHMMGAGLGAGNQMQNANLSSALKQAKAGSPVRRVGGSMATGSGQQNGVLQLKLTQIDSSSSGAQFNALKNGEGMAGCTNNSQQTSDEIGGSEGAIAPGLATAFPNGKSTLQFDEFIEMIRESCSNEESAENYLVFAFSMFDRKRKGYINSEDLKVVFQLLGNEVSDEEINSVKSNDKINFKEFVDFFYKAD